MTCQIPWDSDVDVIRAVFDKIELELLFNLIMRRYTI